MAVEARTLDREAQEWAVDAVLKPQFSEMLRKGTFVREPRFVCDEDVINAAAGLVEAQLEFSRRGLKQTMSALAARTGESAAQVRQVLSSVDWAELTDGVRLRASERGSVPLSESVFVLKTAPHDASGPRVFPACSRAVPPQVEEVLERHDLLPERPPRRQSAATDSSLYLMEVAPGFAQAWRVKGLPEGTQWNPSDERYPVAIRGDVKAALEVAAGGPYTVDTDKILREDVFEPFFASLAAHGRRSELPRPLESGWLSFGPRGFDHRFLGGELKLVRYLQKRGIVPFLDLPRTMAKRRLFKGARTLVPVPGLPVISEDDCIFEIADGRCLEGGMLGWTAEVAFGSVPGGPKTENVFQLVREPLVAMAGGDADSVEYVFTNARVGKADSGKRIRVGLLVRNEGGSLSGWGLPGRDLTKDIVLRRSIEQAERHIETTAAGGDFERQVELLQRDGVQTMGILLAAQREQREGLILAARALGTRAELGV